jgi:hypothetical protein
MANARPLGASPQRLDDHARNLSGLSGGIDDPDVTDHPWALPYFALLGRPQTDLVVSQKHVHAFFNRVCRWTIDQLARVDARERIAHRP